MNVLLAGEGQTELGGWANEPAYRTGEKGVIPALLERVQPGWRIGDAIVWKQIVKYRAGDHREREARNVLGLVERARSCGFAAVVFTRDRDGYVAREEDVEKGIEKAAEMFPDVTIVGGVAVETIEAWILALLGESRSEAQHNPRTVLADTHSIRTVAEKVAAIALADLAAIPEDAGSLHRWLLRAA
ncbi:MAG: hypothetical protein EXR72_16530 [Myxococcales bacterium]|nr:hypothetical protein [Myxococcales bacterium]